MSRKHNDDHHQSTINIYHFVEWSRIYVDISIEQLNIHIHFVCGLIGIGNDN